MNQKEDVDVNKLYGASSIISKEEFLTKYKVSKNRAFK